MTSYESARNRLFEALEKKRTKAEGEAQARKDALRKKYPEFDALCREKEGYLENILLAFTKDEKGAAKDLEKLRLSHRALREREAELLASYGLPAEYLLPEYECKLCSDRGYLENSEMCICLKKELNALRARESGLFSLFEKQTFEGFDLSRVNADMRENFAFCKQYADSFDPQKSGNLLFVGGTGVGKTHLSSAIGRVVLEKGYSVVYESAMTALSAMEMERFSEDKVQTRRLMDAELLILDDLGTELPGKGTVSFLYLLINTRLVAHKPTVLSTNLSAPELESRYEERLFSRLTGEYEVLLFEGTDQRGQD